MANPKALIIDDEPDIRDLIELTLNRMDIDCVTRAGTTSAKAALDEMAFDFCLTDMRLPDGTGLDIVKYVADKGLGLPIAVITAYGSQETAVEALKAGAFDFVSKPVDVHLLRSIVRTALKLEHGVAKGESSPIDEPRSRRKRADRKPRTQIIGRSRAINHVIKLIEKLARSQAPVFISGESGTGKELAARLIHELGPRSDGPFVPVNCGAIPSELMESEFFGHRKGSFTGAVADKEGLFQEADGGTLFLDEVADLPMHMQVKLLRVIQEKLVRPVGATKEQRTDVRILSATHKALSNLVESGDFRQDLFYRINVIELPMPSLRERPDDIPLLAEHLVERIASRWGVEAPPRLSESAIASLQAHAFPGNVRELENLLERAMTLSDDDEIGPEHFTVGRVTGQQPAVRPVATPSGDLEGYVEDIERQAILQALEETRYNKTAAAKKLGITFRAFRYRLKKLGID